MGSVSEMRLTSVLFDLGGTLDDCHFDEESARASVASLRSLIEEAGAEAPADQGDCLALVEKGEAAYRRFREESLIELSPEAAWREYFLAGRGPLPGLSPEIGEALALIVDTRFHVRSLRPEAPRVLRALREDGFRLGVVSNVLSRGQVTADLRRYGIEGLFDIVVTSSHFGRRKPDPSIFLAAAAGLGEEAETCVFVGDRVSRDIVGAKAAGFGLSILLRVENAETGEAGRPEADLIVDSLGELPPALEPFAPHHSHSHIGGLA